MTLSTIPLRQLRLSPLNARSVKSTGIAALAADIDAHGVLQNLIGYEAEDKVMICAGGRRYRALKRLQKDKSITPSFEVPVDIRSIEEALELSLAENTQREDMHPADAILAYRALVDGGMDAEGIAVRFGVSVDHVRRLLRPLWSASQAYRRNEARRAFGCLCQGTGDLRRSKAAMGGVQTGG